METKRLFCELLALPFPPNEEDVIDHIEAMAEVADRQWNTYVLLDSDTRAKLDRWVISAWDRNSAKKSRLLIGIIARVGLERAMEFLKNELKSDLNPLVRNEVEAAIQEFGTTVKDPYSGLRNTKGEE